ncbi:GfV-B22-ORF2 [Ichnoviriform fumiferanae]|uniref:GfV-B22-ORF2 n=1 Tax=Ichnoviriform fumiferanae TaxID=419435 RepID=A2PZS0_9VIRU|nr:GfV-B22-ORF2 [Ichnoviriform fumiferanae]BAF45492.1 GfV-B22-ORF2 [Ichnoviriform fumiferanae]
MCVSCFLDSTHALNHACALSQVSWRMRSVFFDSRHAPRHGNTSTKKKSNYWSFTVSTYTSCIIKNTGNFHVLARSSVCRNKGAFTTNCLFVQYACVDSRMRTVLSFSAHACCFFR